MERNGLLAVQVQRSLLPGDFSAFHCGRFQRSAVERCSGPWLLLVDSGWHLPKAPTEGTFQWSALSACSPGLSLRSSHTLFWLQEALTTSPQAGMAGPVRHSTLSFLCFLRVDFRASWLRGQRPKSRPLALRDVLFPRGLCFSVGVGGSLSHCCKRSPLLQGLPLTLALGWGASLRLQSLEGGSGWEAGLWFRKWKNLGALH